MAHKIEPEWREVTKKLPEDHEGYRHHQVFRMNVPGGWLYKSNESIEFVPRNRSGDF